MDAIKTIFLAIVTSGIAGVAVVWLAKNWISERIKNAIQHEYDAKLETHKAQLSAENGATLEKLKSQLQAAALEREVQFSAVYSKREELLGKLHNTMTAVLVACLEATRPGLTQISSATQEKFHVMHTMMDEAAIYFPEAFCDRWHQHTIELHQTLSTFLAARVLETPNFAGDLERSKVTYEKHLAAYRTMRSELRQEIRQWLGTTSSAPSKS